MVNLDPDVVQKEIVIILEEAKIILKIDAIINDEFRPGNFIMSQVLLTLMGRIGKKLGVAIPDNCYIFHDKKTQSQLTIKQAVQKLIKAAKNGN